MTVLIADDEELVRFTVRSMIEEYREGINIVEADNGKRLLELVEKEAPAIAFVDIRMPAMNGLEAIAEGKKISPMTQWIVLTGHSEFEYARHALDLRVNNYLLKPVDNEELIRALEGAAQLRLKQIKQRNEDFEHYLQALIQNRAASRDENLLSDTLQQFYGYIFFPGIDSDEKNALASLKKVSIDLRCWFEQLDLSIVPAFLYLDEGVWLVVIASSEPEDQANMDHHISHIAEESSFHIVRTVVSDSVEHFFDHVYHLVTGASLCICLSRGEIIPEKSFSHFSDSLRSGKGSEFILLLNHIVSGIERMSDTAFFHALDSLKKICREAPPSEVNPYLGTLCSRLSHLIEISPESFYSALPEKIEFCRQTLKSDSRQETRSALVRKSEQLARKLFSEAVGVAQVAEILQVTPNYLSSVFKSEKGIGFSQFITELRMEKASHLLLDSDMSIKEVAESLGYTGSRHFARIFRERFGIAPSDFTERYRRK
jgi:two-component system, response regulator YesN